MQVTYWGAVRLASRGNQLCVYHGCPTVDSPHRSLVSGLLEGQQTVERLASGPVPQAEQLLCRDLGPLGFLCCRLLLSVTH